MQFQHSTRIKYGPAIADKTKRFIRMSTKIKLLEADTEFIRRCHKNNIRPNFTRIDLADKEQLSQPFVDEFRIKVAKDQVKKKNNEIQQLQKQLSILQNQLNFPDDPHGISQDDWNTLSKLVDEKIKKVLAEKRSVHDKKLKMLKIK